MANNSQAMHVIIVGGGIAGQALALFLKKINIAATIYEAYPYMEGVGGGFNIASNGMNVLAALGVADKVIAHGTPVLRSNFRNGQGKLLAGIKNTDLQNYGQQSVSLSRPTLYKILSEEMKRQNITIHYSKRLTSLNETDNQVVVHFADGSKAHGDILIGADGVHSAVRKYILPEGPTSSYIGLIGIGAFVPVAKIQSIPKKDIDALNFTFGQNGFFGYGGGDKDTIMWWSNLIREKEFSKEELTHLDIQEVKQEMLTRYKGYHVPIEELITQTTAILRLNIYDVLSLPTWHKGRVLLIGDAAHAVNPNAGQGASMALEDAMYLAKLLRDSSDTHNEIFNDFEKERKPRAEKIVAEGRRRGNDKEIVSPFQQKIRELMIRIFVTLFGGKSQDWIFRYKINW
jgi:2-polyprenyl-6-methoxyphenol hydroxylase-like FAD-dependent oxidoreductase